MIFRNMLMFQLCLIALIFAILCWIGCSFLGPIRLTDHRPVAFWIIPASLFALVYYSYALFTEFSGNPDIDRCVADCCCDFRAGAPDGLFHHHRNDVSVLYGHRSRCGLEQHSILARLNRTDRTASGPSVLIQQNVQSRSILCTTQPLPKFGLFEGPRHARQQLEVIAVGADRGEN